MTVMAVLARAKMVIMRHRVTIQDGSLLVAVLLLMTYLAFEIDVFENAPNVPPQEQVIELDEGLGLGALFAAGMLIFAGRRYQEQKREMARRIAAEREARTLALHDALTGLPNRRQFDSALKAAIAAMPRAGACHAVFLLDLNGFKKVNDVHGHGAGDEVLVQVAGRLSKAMREGDLIARFGGDEFAVLAPQLSSAEDATTIALRIIDALKEPVATGLAQHRIGTGIGIALIPQDSDAAEDILRKADIALYRAKTAGMSALRFFEEEMDARVQERDFLENELRAAIGTAALRPYYQPIEDLNTKRIVGFEALARWTHATAGEISPERFIPIAEDCGLIGELSDYLFRQACRDAIAWPGDITLSFNISPAQLRDRTLGLRVLAILGETGLSPRRLELEITESALVRDMEAAQETLGALRQSGIRIALDDFGTGYSSLYHLRNFKLDKIKIDRSFIEKMSTDRESETIVRALVGLGTGLSLTVTAEGVENKGQQMQLIAEGCQQAQGFLFSEALPQAGAMELLKGRQRRRA
ncbi:MAG TPA: EAL domain-containing protein [Micropepsaceae bacterium]|jgi:diguanylate cyclase (GGDEF)-like protein